MIFNVSLRSFTPQKRADRSKERPRRKLYPENLLIADSLQTRSDSFELHQG